MEPERRPRQRVGSSDGRRLLAVVYLRVHPALHGYRYIRLQGRRGSGAGDGELWSSAAAAALVATLTALAAALAAPAVIAAVAAIATLAATVAADHSL